MTEEGVMSEWWTYTLTDFLLFSARTYYRLFELYNAAVWPAQIVTLALGLAILILMIRGAAWSGRAVANILAALWLFVAWAYMLERYDTINWAARYFAIGFAVQAALLVWTGVVRNRLRFDAGGITGKIGLALFLYALAIHPLVPPLTGRPWTQAEIFGLAPDPTAIATLGILVASARTTPLLFAIPFLWCLFTSLTLWTMESPEAPAAVLLGLLALAAGTRNILVRHEKTP
jgi:hypothetical protein